MFGKHRMFFQKKHFVQGLLGTNNHWVFKMAYFGFIKQKQCWVLTIRSWFIIFIIIAALVILTVIYVHPFLAMNRPVHGDLLVVEGWVPDYVLEQAIVEFNANNYQLLITTGGPLEKGVYLSEYKTYAELAAATLIKLGLSENLVVSVPAKQVNRDRTYASAVALKKWLLKSHLSIKSLDICSVGTHARRSWLLYERALGDTVTVGVIAVESEEYEPQRWWKFSDGVRKVIGEMIAYFYARFVFHPSE